jgi:hypothetical protein
MSGSEEPQAGLVSIEDQGTIMALLDVQGHALGFAQLTEACAQTREVLTRVAQYSQQFRQVKMLCEHPQRIIYLQRQIPELQMNRLLPPQCDHTRFEQQIHSLRNDRDEAKKRPAVPVTDQDLRQELADMTQDAPQSGEEVHRLRMQLANALMLATRAAPAAPQAPEDRGQKIPDSSDLSESERTKLTGWIAQLQMVIQHKPTSFPDEQSKMWYLFTCLR